MGLWFQRPGHHQSRSNPDAVFDVSLAGTALDRRARRVDATHDLPARQAIDEHVQALLSRRAGFRAAAIMAPGSQFGSAWRDRPRCRGASPAARLALSEYWRPVGGHARANPGVSAGYP